MIEAKTNARGLSRALGEISGTVTTRATAYALNDTGASILDRVRENMRARFDAPTPFALNALMIWRAKPERVPVAEVKERPSAAKRHFLKIQERGGARPLTGSEAMLQRAMGGQRIAAIVPLAPAAKDRAGNWRRSERKKVLDAVMGKVPQMEGAKVLYTLVKPGEGRAPGIYARPRGGDPVRLARISTRPPRYQPRLGFYDAANEVFMAEYSEHFDRIFTRLSKKVKDGA